MRVVAGLRRPRTLTRPSADPLPRAGEGIDLTSSLRSSRTLASVAQVISRIFGSALLDLRHPQLDLLHLGPLRLDLGGTDFRIGLVLRHFFTRDGFILEEASCASESGRGMFGMGLRYGQLRTLPDQLDLKPVCFLSQLVVHAAEPAGQQADLVGRGLVLISPEHALLEQGRVSLVAADRDLELGLELAKRGTFAGADR